MFSDDQWTVLSLPPRYFSWRIRGNSLSWAFQHRELLERQYDLLIATSMVDLSALRGFVPTLAPIPTLVYFHENQFAYPNSGQQFSSVEPQLLNLYTALAADRLAFNSAFNRDTFLSGAEELLARLPDQVPPNLINRLAERSEVLPVPIEREYFCRRSDLRSGPLHILWNHRWEYDKAPERLFAALQCVLQEQGVELILSIVGQQFRQMPTVFTEMKSWLQTRHPAVLKHWGYLDSLADYRQLLGQADVVVSTAVHDFQGLAVIEAVAAGCVPVLPDRLCYGEWFDSQYRYDSFPDQPEQEARALADRLLLLAHQKQQGTLIAAPDLAHFSVDCLEVEYRRLFQQLNSAPHNGHGSGEPVS
jgi:glycosyltransferase involved in cell wall biosynthesis